MFPVCQYDNLHFHIHNFYFVYYSLIMMYTKACPSKLIKLSVTHPTHFQQPSPPSRVVHAIITGKYLLLVHRLLFEIRLFELLCINRGIANLAIPGGQETVPLFLLLTFVSIFPIFSQISLIFVPILVFPVSDWVVHLVKSWLCH